MNVRKRLLAYIMCYVLAFAMLPAPAVGAEDVTGGDVGNTDNIANTGEGPDVSPKGAVELNGNGGSGSGLTSYTCGEETDLPVDWTKKGYTFQGWYDNKELNGNPVTKILETDTGDKSYWAKWEPVKYAITYELNGGKLSGNELNQTSYTIESEDIILKNPEKEGCSFTGWSGTDLTGENNITVTIQKGSTGNRSYTAHWSENSYTVTLNGNGGSGSGLPGYTYGKETDLPVDWTRKGYTFQGWYDNKELNGNPVTKILETDTGVKSYWAKWEPVKYAITYELNGGKLSGNEPNQTSYTIESEDIILKNPEKEGCSFTGWSGTDLTGENNITVTIQKGSTGNRSYTAHWSENSYTVTLNGNGGSGSGLPGYTYGKETDLPVDWTRKGYTFQGWYDNKELNGNPVTKISKIDTGDKSYWAKWIDNIAPVIGTLSHSYQLQNVEPWLIGKETLTITVPVIEEGSGADEISYIMKSASDAVTSESPSEQQKTAKIQNGSAEITVSADFKGTITISCRDEAGNTSDEKELSLIIENNVPEIAFWADGGEILPSGYSSAPEITVTVKDDKNNIISGGLKSVTYQVGNNAEVSIEQDYTENIKAEIEFSIDADQIPRGTTDIVVRAEDNAGNLVEKILPIHIHDGTLVEEEAATCKKEGHDAYYICECGRWFFDKDYTKEVKEKEDVKQLATGRHNTDYQNYRIKQPTDTQEGKLIYRCSVCGDIQETLPLPKKKIEIELGQTADIISNASKCTFQLINADKYQNYLTLDPKTGEIKTNTKNLKNVKKIEKSADIQVTTGGMTYNVKASIAIPAPEVKIITKKVGDRYRFTFKYNVKKLGANKIKVTCSLKGLRKDVFKRYLSSPKSNKDSYVNLYLGKNKKVKFTVTACYGKKGKIASQKTVKTFAKMKNKLKEVQ